MTPEQATALRTANSASELYLAALNSGLEYALTQPLRRLWERSLISEGAASMLRLAVPNAEVATLHAYLGDPQAQRELKRRTTSEVRRDVLRGARLMLEKPDRTIQSSRTGSAGPALGAGASAPWPTSREALDEWATAAGVPEILDAPVHSLGSEMDGSQLPPGYGLGRQMPTLAEALLKPSHPGARPFVQRPPRGAAASSHAVPPEVVWRFLQRYAAATAEAVRTEGTFLQAGPPALPVLAEFHAALLTARAQQRETTLPASEFIQKQAKVSFQHGIPALRVDDPRPVVDAWNIATPRLVAPLERWREQGIAFRCSVCPRESVCRHRIFALDAAIGWVRALGGRDAEEVASVLGTPPWLRSLQRLRETAADRPDAKRTAEEPGPQRIAWRVDAKGRELRLRPFLQRPTRKGGWTVGVGLRPEDLLELEVRDARPQDRRAAAMLRFERMMAPGQALWEALQALEGHPHLHLVSAPDRPVRIEELDLELCCTREPSGGYAVGPSVRGVAVSLEALSPAWRGQGRYCLADAERETVFLVRVDDRVARVLSVLKERGAHFPDEAADELVDALGEMPVPVSLPPTLLGPEVDADGSAIAMARMEGLTLSVEALVRPLPGAHIFPAGEGPRQVRGQSDGQRVYAQRRTEAERVAAAKLFEALGLPPVEAGQTFRAVVDGLEAIAVLSRLEALARDGLEVLWPLERPKLTRPVTGADLRVVVRPARDWLGVTGGAEVDDQRIALAVLLEAARRRQRFVRVAEGRWAELSQELLGALEPLADLAVENAAGDAEVTVAAAQVLEELSGAVGGFEGTPRLSDLLGRMRAAQSLKPALPSGLRAELRPYQREGFEWLARLSAWAPGACLADDMGLGKTLQTLALLVDRAEHGPQLVVAPTSVCFNWEREAARFAPGLRVHAWRTADREALCGRLGPGDVLVVSYGLLTRDVERLKAIPFVTAVFDEAQAVKNAGARRSQAARQLSAEFRVALSGTPVENHLGELWSLMRLVFPGLLGTEGQFRERFQAPIERHRNPDRRRALAGIVRPFLLRRTKAQVAADLPARTEITVPVALSPQERRLYDDARLAAVAELSGAASGPGENKRFQVLAALTRLRLLVCHPRLHDPSWTGPASKLGRVMELLTELREEGHRALVFSQFTRHLGIARTALEGAGFRVQYLDGETPEAERRRRVEAFQSGAGDVFLISLKAGGTGLNLTGADYVLHLDPWWNPAVEDQATDRAHRIGQMRPVTVYRLVTQGTIEEQIVALHAQKRELLAGVVDGSEEPSRLEVEELVGLLRRAGGLEEEVVESDVEAGESEEAVPEAERGDGSGAVAREVLSTSARKEAPDVEGLTAAFARWMAEQCDRGLIGPGPVKQYPPAVRRFLDFAADSLRDGQDGSNRAAYDDALEAYLGAMATGHIEAKKSEPGVARSAVRKFVKFMAARA